MAKYQLGYACPLPTPSKVSVGIFRCLFKAIIISWGQKKAHLPSPPSPSPKMRSSVRRVMVFSFFFVYCCLMIGLVSSPIFDLSSNGLTVWLKKITPNLDKLKNHLHLCRKFDQTVKLNG